MAEATRLRASAELPRERAAGVSRWSRERSRRLAEGQPDDPLTWDTLQAKFLALAGRALDKRRAEELLRMLTSLELVEDVRVQRPLLRPPADAD